jgi:ribokinase
VVVTLGAEGAYLAAPEGHHRVPAHRVEAVDATGAGDVFNGALAVALVEGAELPRAVRFAGAAAALSVTREGAQPSAPRRAEILRLLGE